MGLGLGLDDCGGSAASLLILTLFLAIENRSKAPLVKLSIFRIRLDRDRQYGTMLLVASAMFGMFFFVSLYVQEILGYSPLKAGLAFLPGIAGDHHRRRHQRRTWWGGSARATSRLAACCLATAGMAMFTGGSRSTGPTCWTSLRGLMPLTIGLGLVFVPVTLLAHLRRQR